MKSRYGLWVVSICWLGLAGCANWQNRINNTSPGSAATMTPGGNQGALTLNAPGSAFGEPPPPMAPPPSDLNSSLAPLGAPPMQKLDLSAVDGPAKTREVSNSRSSSSDAVPAKMYNLESSRKPSSSSSSGSSAKKSSAITRLATKAGTAGSSSKIEEASEPRVSTVQKLAASSQSSPVKPVAPETAAEVQEELPQPAPVKAQVETPAAVDTTLLAQPVRKGASSEETKSEGKESKGPQSRLIPGGKLFNEKNKPVIYPVSHPVADEPVNIIRFS